MMAETSKTVVIYGALSALDPTDVTRNLWTRTGGWVDADTYWRLRALLREAHKRLPAIGVRDWLMEDIEAALSGERSSAETEKSDG
jgi:hypothetical protein